MWDTVLSCTALRTTGAPDFIFWSEECYLQSDGALEVADRNVEEGRMLVLGRHVELEEYVDFLNMAGCVSED